MRFKYTISLYSDQDLEVEISDYLQEQPKTRRQEIIRTLLKAGFLAVVKREPKHSVQTKSTELPRAKHKSNQKRERSGVTGTPLVKVGSASETTDGDSEAFVIDLSDKGGKQNKKSENIEKEGASVSVRDLEDKVNSVVESNFFDRKEEDRTLGDIDQDHDGDKAVSTPSVDDGEVSTTDNDMDLTDPLAKMKKKFSKE